LEPSGKRDLRLLIFSPELHTERDFAALTGYWDVNEVPALQDHIAYADLAAYLAFTTASVDDLNGRLEAKGVDPISDRNFRPSILITNLPGAPKLPSFDEDRWLSVRIGKSGEASEGGEGAEFHCYKPCTRCVLTTVNPDRGEKHPQVEPLKELRNYRLAPEGKLLDLYKDSPIFGVNMALAKQGRVRVGDEVWVRYKPIPY